MALVLCRDLEVWWPVKVGQPADGGEIQEYEIELRVSVPSPSSVRELLEAADGAAQVSLDAENRWITKHVVGWRGVHDNDGMEMKFSQDNLDLLLDHPGGRKAVVGSLLDVARSKVAAGKKTSSKSPAGGQATDRRLN